MNSSDNFVIEFRDLLDACLSVETTTETFENKIHSVLQLFSFLNDKLMILHNKRFVKLLDIIIKKCTEIDSDLTSTYTLYNKYRRLNPSTKKYFRELRDLLPQVRENLVAIQNDMEQEPKVQESKVQEPKVQEPAIRRSSRLQNKKT